MRKRSVALLAAAVASCVPAWRVARAETKTWVGGTGANWDTPEAWDTPGEPAATDDAVFPTPVPAAPGRRSR